MTSSSLLHQGQIDQASKSLEKAWQALEDGPDRIEDGRLHAQAMLVALAARDMEQAQAHRMAAEQVFKQLGAARDLAQLEAVEIS